VEGGIDRPGGIVLVLYMVVADLCNFPEPGCAARPIRPNLRELAEVEEVAKSHFHKKVCGFVPGNFE